MQLKYKEGGAYKAYCPIPVHGVYLSLDNGNPNAVWPGTTWRKVIGGLLACAGTAGYAAAGSTGGSKEISIEQMPSHIHTGTRTITTTLKNNTEGGENFALSGVIQDSIHTFDKWTNATGGGQTTTRFTSPSMYGRERRSPSGGATCLASSSGAAATSSPTVHGASETSCSRRPPRTRTSNGRGLLGRSTRRTGSPSAQARRMRLGTQAEPLRSLCRSRRCRAIPTSYRATITSCSSARDGRSCPASRTSTSTTRLAVKSHALREAAARMRTALRTLPSTFGGALHRGAVA